MSVTEQLVGLDNSAGGLLITRSASAGYITVRIEHVESRFGAYTSLMCTDSSITDSEYQRCEVFLARLIAEKFRNIANTIDAHAAAISPDLEEEAS